MKRVWVVAALTITMTLGAWGQRSRGHGSIGIRYQGIQFRGVPASVTSPTAINPAPGVPSSVMSPTPCMIGGGAGCGVAFGGGSSFHNRGHVGRGGHSRRNRAVYPTAYPVYYPYAYADVYDSQPVPPVQIEIKNEIPGPTVFEHDGRIPPVRDLDERASAADEARYGTHYLDERERRSARSEPQPAPEPLEIVSTMLIYRDGKKREVRNYAILGDTLYEIGGLRSRKVPLADLDLDATRRENDERGVEFAVPEGPREQ